MRNDFLLLSTALPFSISELYAMLDIFCFFFPLDLKKPNKIVN